MPSYRRGQINDAMKKQLALIVRDIKDPRVANNFVSITAAEVAPDLKTAKVFFSAMTGEKKDIIRGLVSATGFIRKRLAETLNLRITPELTFVADESISYGAHINELLQQIKQTDQEKAVSAAVTTADEEKDNE